MEKQVGQCFIHIEKHILDIIKYSGRYLFRLGQYYHCIDQPDMDYFFLQFGAKGTNDKSISYGTCLPRACSANNIQAIVNSLLDNAKIPLNMNGIQSSLNNQHPQFNFSFYLTFAIVIILLTLVLISSFSKKSSEVSVLAPFSIKQTNKLFKYQEGSRLNVLNGVRSLAMLWVIYGHAMSMAVGYSQNIITIQQNVLFDWRFLTVEAGLYSVDTFFFVGGFLLAYSFLKQQEKVKTGYKYLLAILNRYLRLIPAYFLAIMIYYSVYPHMGSGPFWQQSQQLSNMCHSLWRPLLFVDNLVDNGNNMCMAWGWYLQNDIQLFIYCIFILFVLNKSKSGAYFLIFLSMTANFAFVMQETYENQERWLTHISDASASQRYQLNIYYKPWARCPPYLYGLFLGILYNQFLVFQARQNKLKPQQLMPSSVITSLEIEIQDTEQDPNKPLLSKLKQQFMRNPIKRRVVQLVGVAICLLICFIPRTAQGKSHIWSQFVHSFYLTYCKLFFVVGLSFIIIPSTLLPSKTQKYHQKQCRASSNTLVKFLLDTKLFNFVAKVSFCTYLIHLILLLVYFNSTKTDFYYALYPSFTIFLTFAVLSILCGTLMVYLVEAPFSKFQKQLLTKLMKGNNKQREKKEVKLSNNEIVIQSQIKKQQIAEAIQNQAK